MVSDNRNDLEDQLNILFDDFSDAAEEVREEAKRGFEDEMKELDENITSAGNELVDDTASLHKEHADFDFDAFEELIEDEDDDEEAEIPKPRPARPQRPAVKEADEEDDDEDDDIGGRPVKKVNEEKKAAPKPQKAKTAEASEERPKKEVQKKRSAVDDMQKESVHFWIFTAIIALIVAAAVLFILWKRGYIFNSEEPTSAAPIETEAPTTEAPTTEAPTTEAPTTEAPTEESTEPSSEEVTETEEDKSAVLNNYNNIFVVTGTGTLNVRQYAGPDAAIIATIDEFGGGEILEQVNEYYHIVSGGIDGYVHSSFCTTGDEAKQIAVEHAEQQVKVTADTVNVRMEASTEGQLVEAVGANTLWKYMGDEVDNFYHIKYSETYPDCYVSKDFSVLGYFLNEAKAYSPEGN